MNWSAIIWLVLLVLFILAEAATVTVVSLWFAAGSLVALIVSMLNGPVWLQIVLFAVVSGVLLWILRPVIKKHFTPKLTRTNIDAVIGSTGVVTVAIDNAMAQGTMLINGMEWSARSASGKSISVNTLVRVERVEGVRVFVSPVEVTAVK